MALERVNSQSSFELCFVLHLQQLSDPGSHLPAFKSVTGRLSLVLHAVTLPCHSCLMWSQLDFLWRAGTPGQISLPTGEKVSLTNWTLPVQAKENRVAFYSKNIYIQTHINVCVCVYIDTLIYTYVYNILLDECFFILHLRLTVLFWEKSNHFPCQRAATQPVHSVWERQVSHLRRVIFQLHSIPFIICFKNTVCKARKNRSCRGKKKIN